MNCILFTDTHFGVKLNSVTWLKSQAAFIEEQLIPYIEGLDEHILLVHLGDVFDSRSTISTMVAKRVHELFTELASISNVEEFIVIGGNHDYYYPTSNEVDSLELMLSDIKKIRIVNKECYVRDQYLFVPWYEYFETDKINMLISENDIKSMFTHADIVTEQSPYNIDVYSGHIHYPNFKPGRYNLGSCYPLTFSDSNQNRCFYYLKDSSLASIPNSKSIRFWRLYNEQIVGQSAQIENDGGNYGSNDYIELYIDKGNQLKQEYIDAVNAFVKHFKNIWIIPQGSITTEDDIAGQYDNFNIETIVTDAVPQELHSKFDQILQSLQQ